MPTTTRRTRSTAVGVELGHKRVFACALDWPGWCRSGKSEELALEALAAYAPRYAVVAEQAGMELPARVGDSFEVVERVQGSGATDFGVPHEVVDHVLGAEVAYARKLGIKHPQPARDDRAAIEAIREEILAVLRAPSDGAPPVPKGWPPRYAARRIAWHALDHAWEIEDRSDTGS